MTPFTINRSDARLPVGFDPHPTGRIFLYVAMVTLCVAAIAAMGGILFSDYSETGWQIMLSAIAITLYSLVGLIAMGGHERGVNLFPVVGLGTAGVGLPLSLAYIWTGGEYDFLARLTFSAFVLGASVVHANLLMPDPDADDPAAGFLILTLCANAVSTGMAVIPLLIKAEPGDGYWKAFAVLFVLLVLGTLAVPILRRLKAGNESASGPWVPMENPDTWLRISYRGRSITVAPGSESDGIAQFRAWDADGPDLGAISLYGEQAADDPYAALGFAVQQITRAIDTGEV